MNATLNLPDDEDLVMDLFLDGSVLEVFINDAFAYSARIFPDSDESIYIDLFAENGTAIFKTVDVWELHCKDETDLINSIDSPNALENKDLITTIFPNPTDGKTTIAFELKEKGKVSFIVYDILGKELLEIPAQSLPSGNHNIEIDTQKFSEGKYNQVYLLEMRLDSVPVQVEKIILQK